MAMQAQPAVSIVPHSLQAVLEKRPGSGQRHLFRVTVDIEIFADWTAELAAAVPQGINPLIKLLRLKIAGAPQPTGATAPRRTLHYLEAPPGADYSEVWLGDGDKAISVRVEVVA